MGKVTVESSTAKERHSFQYCGIHSNMINYPPGRNVSIHFTPLASVNESIKINITFSVCDAKTIISRRFSDLYINKPS